LNERRRWLLFDGCGGLLGFVVAGVKRLVLILFQNSGEGLVACLAFWSVDKIVRRGIAFLVSSHGAGVALCLVGLFLLEVLVGFYAVKNFVALPLGPHEVVVAPLLVVAHTPPKSCF